MLMLNMILDIIRSLLFFFDQIIYGFIPTLYKFIELLALQKLFTEESLQDLAGNVYAVLGVFMLFRLAFVLLNAIIDPDKLNDKQKGFPKMLGRVVVALVLIVAIPWAFSFAYKLQSTIIKENLIGKIILGSDAAQEQDPGQQMGEMALKAFLDCNPSVAKGTADNQCDADALQEKGFDAAFPKVNDETGKTGAASFEYLSTHLNDEAQPANGEEGEVYKYSYTAGISTIAGGFILAMLVVFVFDIATRVVKLGFLQLIAPVAVIGYIEPGGGMFNRWLKMCTSTYINLFVRILSITFVVYVLSLLGDSLIFDSITDENGLDAVKAFTKVFIIFGALMFAKEAPAMIKNLFDLKEDSIGTLNPMKKLGAVPLVGGLAAAGIGAGVGLGASGAAKLSAMGTGALGGGLGSKLRGGSFMAGAKAGGAAGNKKVPLTGKPKYGNMFGAALGAGAMGAAAGFTSDAAKEAAIKSTIAKAGGDASALFKNEGLKSDFRDFSAKKAAVKQQKSAMTTHKNNYSDSQLKYKTSSDALLNANNRYSQSSQALAAAKSNRDSALAKAAKLKQDMESVRPSDPNIISPTYSAAKREYESYIASGGEYDNANRSYTSAETTYSSAQADLNTAQAGYTSARRDLEDSQTALQSAAAGLDTAERDFSDSETRFKAKLDDPSNKKDAENYKTYKHAKDAGRM